MASAFDLFGTLNLETKAFENSVRRVADRLKATDSALDQTIARSNKLGDTSATVARRYEKLGEGIAAQRQRLISNALAFEKGEINAKKFASTVTSVDRAVLGLNSRIKDANARISELSETGFTHFQNQISGAVAPQTTDLFKRLSSFQKTQLSFQVNDIITGLASGQNPLQILAQQGGQIVQIFQMSKVAQEGTAAATAAAAASEAAFATSAKGAAVSQQAVAVSSAATATSMEGAAASATVLGASVVSLGAILAAGLVTILAVWKATKDIAEAAQKRLQTEEAIAAALNKQRLAQVQFEEQRKQSQSDRDFGGFLQSGDAIGLQTARQSLQRELNQILATIDAEKEKRGVIASLIPTGGENTKKFLAGAETEAQTKQIELLRERILKLDEAIDGVRQSSIKATNFDYLDFQKRQLQANAEAVQAQADAEKKYAEERKKMVEEAIKKAKEWVEHVKGAKKEIENIYSSTSDNPFVRIFSEGQKAVERMMEATKGLGGALQGTLAGLLQNDTAAKAYGQSLDNAIRAVGLRSEAKAFRNGAFINQSPSERLAEQFRALSTTGDQDTLNKRIIALTQGLDPSQLTYRQNQIAAKAREDEAKRLDKEQVEAKKLLIKQNEILDSLGKAVQSGTLIEVRNESDRAKISTGSAANVTGRYGRN